MMQSDITLIQMWVARIIDEKMELSSPCETKKLLNNRDTNIQKQECETIAKQDAPEDLDDFFASLE